MNLADLLKKNIVMVPVVASVLVGTFTGVRYIVNLTDTDRKSTRLNSSHGYISYAVFCLEKKTELQSRLNLVCRLLLGKKILTPVTATYTMP